MIYGKIMGAYSTPSPSAANPSVKKFASQANFHVRSDAQIKFLYYPLCVNIYIRKRCLMLVSLLNKRLNEIKKYKLRKILRKSQHIFSNIMLRKLMIRQKK